MIDHTLNFVADGDSIVFKNYQVFREPLSKDETKIDLYEIGPRLIMKTVCILDEVMGG